MLKKSRNFVPKCRLGGATNRPTTQVFHNKLFLTLICFVVMFAAVFGVVFGVVKNNDGEDPTTALTGPINTDTWTSNSTYYDTLWSGSGTSTDPFLIEDAADLAGLAYSTNHGTN